ELLHHEPSDARRAACARLIAMAMPRAMIARARLPHSGIGSLIMSSSRWKFVTYLLVILAGVIVAAPNFLTASQLGAWPEWLQKQHVTLGLDIKGGSHLVLEVDTAALERDNLDALLERARSALRDVGITDYSATTTPDAVLVRVDDPARRTEAERVLRATVSSVS